MAEISKIHLPSGDYDIKDTTARSMVGGSISFKISYDGSAAPNVAEVPQGVVIIHNGQSYTGTLTPANAANNTFYLIKDTSSEEFENIYEEYLVIKPDTTSSSTWFWEKVGDTKVDISGKIDTAGTGLSKSGTTLNHTNSITAQTTQAVYPIKIDSEGHISGYGTAVTSMPASDVQDWAKASTKPSYGLSEISGTDDLRAIEEISGTNGLLKKTGANNWGLDTNSYLTSETDPVFGASEAAKITAADIISWNEKTTNTGTVTSVRVQATSPVQSSVSTAQSILLNTTISLADGYGDIKNPYGTKTKNYVLAGPTTGSAAAPSFRALVVNDIPDLSSIYLTSHQDISGKADKSATVSTVTWDSTHSKLTKTINGTTTDVVTIATIKAALALPDPMVFKGSLGTGGTITSLPTAATSNKGYTYKVITAGTYASQAAKIGDTFVSDGSSWVLIPSGDEPSGTVTSVGIQSASNNTISVSGGPVTTSGTFTLGLKLNYVTSGNNRAVQADSNGNLYVAQKDDNTTYSAGTGLSLSSTTFSVKTGYTTSGNNRAVQADSNGNLYVTQKDTNTYVTQTATTTSANYEVLFSNTADNTTRTEGARKSNKITFNPSTGVLYSQELKVSLDTNAASGTDYQLTNGLTALGWLSDVIS